MRYLASLALTLILSVGAFADSKDDIRAFVRSQANPTSANVSKDTDIKEFARYQRERQRTYADAVDKHNQTKTVVIVWVGFSDNDELFQRWSQTKDLGYHVFVDKFDSVFTGVVVGRDFSGTFGRLETITDNYVIKITEQALAKFEPSIAPSTTTCVGGKCYSTPATSSPFRTTPYYGSGSSSCPGGNCPAPRR